MGFQQCSQHLSKSAQILSIMNRLVAIGEAVEALGVSITTLRRWEVEGRMIPERTASGHRRYRSHQTQA